MSVPEDMTMLLKLVAETHAKHDVYHEQALEEVRQSIRIADETAQTKTRCGVETTFQEAYMQMMKAVDIC